MRPAKKQAVPSRMPDVKPASGPALEDGAGGDDVKGRTCIVTRQSGTPDGLIRFVAAPDGRVVADLKRQLPGRGCWVGAERVLVEKAIAKKLFARALKADVTADAALADEIDRLLAQQLAGMMNMARKAAQFINGAAKVDQAVRAGAAIGVFHASDAAADGVRKIDQARKAWRLGMGEGVEIPVFRPFTGAELDGLLASNSFIHAAALAGQAGEGVVKRAIMLDKYRGNVPVRAHDGAGDENQ